MTKGWSVVRVGRYTLWLSIAVIVCFAGLNSAVLLREWVLTRFYPAIVDARSTYPNYRDIEWAETHFTEFRKIKTAYRPFVAWRRQGFRGSTINVDATYGIRWSSGQQFDGSVYFLGGSTMWGTGADDATTIPSAFHRHTGLPVLNVGESAYTTRQSLDMLLNMLSYGYRPAAVVSYEGFNDVGVNCRRTAMLVPTHDYESYFRRQLMQQPSARFFSAVGHFFMFFPTVLKIRLLPAAPIGDTFVCTADAERRRRVAQAIVDNWKFMDAIAHVRGFAFYAVLQPSAFSAKSRIDHLPSGDLVMREEFDAVFATVRELTAAQCGSGACGVYSDLSRLDFGDRYVFIDNAHMSPDGNAAAAAALARIVKLP